MPLLSGMVYCADCGFKLYQVRSKNWNHDKEYMMCATYRKRGKHNCTSHQIRNIDIEKALLYMIQQVTAFARDYEDEFVELVAKNKNKELERKIRECKKELEQSMNRVSKIDLLIQRLYEDNVEGKISDEQFIKMTSAYENEQQKSESPQRRASVADKRKRDPGIGNGICYHRNIQNHLKSDMSHDTNHQEGSKQIRCIVCYDHKPPDHKQNQKDHTDSPK